MLFNRGQKKSEWLCTRARPQYETTAIHLDAVYTSQRRDVYKEKMDLRHKKTEQ